MKAVISPRRKNFDKKNISILEKELSLFSQFLSGIQSETFLVGGLAVALKYGKFYRSNKDFDIAIFDSDLEQFYCNIQNQGYGIYQRQQCGHISPWQHLSILKFLTTKEILDGKHTKLRVLKETTSPLQFTQSRQDYFDLFLLKKNETTVELLEQGISVPKEEFFPLTHINYDGVGDFVIPNFQYRKRMFRNPVQKLDLAKVGVY